MTEKPLFKAWEVLTCKNGHPQWIVVKPIFRGFETINHEVTPIGKRGRAPYGIHPSLDEWYCECGAMSYGGSYKKWVLYVKGKPRK